MGRKVGYLIQQSGNLKLSLSLKGTSTVASVAWGYLQTDYQLQVTPSGPVLLFCLGGDAKGSFLLMKLSCPILKKRQLQTCLYKNLKRKSNQPPFVSQMFKPKYHLLNLCKLEPASLPQETKASSPMHRRILQYRVLQQFHTTAVCADLHQWGLKSITILQITLTT